MLQRTSKQLEDQQELFKEMKAKYTAKIESLEEKIQNYRKSLVDAKEELVRKLEKRKPEGSLQI